MRCQIILISNLGIRVLKDLATLLKTAPFKFKKMKNIEVVLVSGTNADLGFINKLTLKKFFKFKHVKIEIGAGTSYFAGQKILDTVYDKLRKIFDKEIDFRFVVAGLSGGTGTAFLTHPDIVDMLFETCDPKHTIIMTVLPGRSEIPYSFDEDTVKAIAEISAIELEHKIAEIRYTKITDVATLENSIRRVYNLAKFFTDVSAQRLLRSVRAWIALVNEPTPADVDRVITPVLLANIVWMAQKYEEAEGEDPANLHGLMTAKLFISSTADIPMSIYAIQRRDLPRASPAVLPRRDSEVFPLILTTNKKIAERTREALYRTYQNCRLGATIVLKARKRRNLQWLVLYEKIDVTDLGITSAILKAAGLLEDKNVKLAEILKTA